MDVISVSWISKLTQRIYSSPIQLPSPPKTFGPHSQSVFYDILQLFACTATIHSVVATAAKEQQKKFIRFLWRWKKFSFSIFLLFARDRRLSSSSSILITGIPWEKTTSYCFYTMNLKALVAKGHRFSCSFPAPFPNPHLCIFRRFCPDIWCVLSWIIITMQTGISGVDPKFVKRGVEGWNSCAEAD